MLDGSWNPQNDEQAAARIHRNGQTHFTQVVRFVLRGTYEEHIHTTQCFKLKAAVSLLDEKGKA